MADKTVVNYVYLTSVNNVTEEEQEQLVEAYDADDFEEVVSVMEESFRAAVAQTFREADSIPLLEVKSKVEEEWDEDDMEHLDLRP